VTRWSKVAASASTPVKARRMTSKKRVTSAGSGAGLCS
jgi:hypothetical protein